MAGEIKQDIDPIFPDLFSRLVIRHRGDVTPECMFLEARLEIIRFVVVRINEQVEPLEVEVVAK